VTVGLEQCCCTQASMCCEACCTSAESIDAESSCSLASASGLGACPLVRSTPFSASAIFEKLSAITW
jgi:hypothetical protein